MNPLIKKLSGAGGVLALIGAMFQMLHSEQQVLRKENQELRDRVIVLETKENWQHGTYALAEEAARKAVEVDRELRRSGK